MVVKVVNRKNPELHVLYENVKNVTDVFDENRNYCHMLHVGEETATFPVCEWEFYKMDWVSLF